MPVEPIYCIYHWSTSFSIPNKGSSIWAIFELPTCKWRPCTSYDNIYLTVSNKVSSKLLHQNWSSLLKFYIPSTLIFLGTMSTLKQRRFLSNHTVHNTAPLIISTKNPFLNGIDASIAHKVIQSITLKSKVIIHI
jgi:hypothetical protein